MKKLVLLLTLTLTALSAHAQIGQTYRELVGHFGRGAWNGRDSTYNFTNGFYCVKASFGTGHQRYCDLIQYTHRDGSDFTRAEIGKLARRTYNGKWYGVKPAKANDGTIGLWGVDLRGVDFYIMLYNTTVHRDDDPSFKVAAQLGPRAFGCYGKHRFYQF